MFKLDVDIGVIKFIIRLILSRDQLHHTFIDVQSAVHLILLLALLSARRILLGPAVIVVLLSTA